MGDEVQGMKAGLAEIADILVVNKADLPGADVTFQQLKGIFRTSIFSSPQRSTMTACGNSLMTSKSIGSRISATVTITGSGSAYAARSCCLCCARD